MTILKEGHDDDKVFRAYLLMNGIKIISADFYFAIKLYNLAEKYHKLSLVCVPISYLQYEANSKCLGKRP